MELIIVNGLYLGAQYALIALGLTLIFALMNVLNFAHGQMFVLGGFVTYGITEKLFNGLGLALPLAFICGLLAAVVVLMIVGALFERFLFRTVTKRSARDESTMLLAAGTAFLLDSIILIVFGQQQKGLPDGKKLISGIFQWDGIIIAYDRILVAAISVLMITAFILYMQWSRTGRAMRALAQDKMAATLMGVNVDFYTMLGFAFGAALAGIVGGLLFSVTGINSGLGDPTSVKAFTMVMLGGAGVVSGAIWGGVILGMLESVLLSLLPLIGLGDLTHFIIFASLMVFLAIRPQGLMGKPWG
ncbi:MAG: branched-chain amino acid ABC transporter permease [Alphaproteobacteria bacterium]|nr:branched-chain amino acid ABC transporter permease [Alphaproteobacteria bacterium]